MKHLIGWRLLVVSFGIVACVGGIGAHASASGKALHAYTLKRTPVLNGKGRRVATLEKGITICYSKRNGNYVQFSYYGKKRYLKAGTLVLDGRMDAFIRKNLGLFDRKLRMKSAACVYRDASLKKRLYSASTGEEFKVYGGDGTKFKVQVDGRFGYVANRGVQERCYVNVITFPKLAGSTTAQKLINYAKMFVGNPYVWGGTSLTSGCDCSGFVQQVYRKFGYRLPRCSYEQAEVGQRVPLSSLKPGDLIFYRRGGRIGHVTLYIGGGKVVQARGSRYGIVITDYDYSTPAWAQRIL